MKSGISDTRGDGAGYDIASFERDESPRSIEVKTTGSGKQFPFLVTSNEVNVSQREEAHYHLYRVFEFAKAPRLYVLQGDLAKVCRLEATQFRQKLVYDGLAHQQESKTDSWARMPIRFQHWGIGSSANRTVKNSEREGTIGFCLFGQDARVLDRDS